MSTEMAAREAAKSPNERVRMLALAAQVDEEASDWHTGGYRDGMGEEILAGIVDRFLSHRTRLVESVDQLEPSMILRDSLGEVWRMTHGRWCSVASGMYIDEGMFVAQRSPLEVIATAGVA